MIDWLSPRSSREPSPRPWTASTVMSTQTPYSGTPSNRMSTGTDTTVSAATQKVAAAEASVLLSRPRGSVDAVTASPGTVPR